MKRLFFYMGFVLGGMIFTVMLISAMDHIDLIKPTNMFYGSDFIPASWIVLFAFVPLLLFAVSHRWKWTVGFLCLMCFYFAAFGDYSLSLFMRKKLQNSSAYQKVSVAALNVEYYTQGVDSVFHAIMNLGADVTLLSENDIPDSTYQRLVSAIAPMQFRMGHPRSTALLSRFPIKEFHEIELPSYEASLSGSNDIDEMPRHPHRSFVHAVVTIRGTDVHFLSIRFIAGRPKDHSLEENIRWGKYLLAMQMDEVAAFMKYVDQLKGPIIFGGDLNAPPSSKPMRVIERKALDVYMADHFWGDCTFRTDFPKMRLDYLFCLNQVLPEHTSRPRIYVSDHFPVTAEVWLPVQSSIGQQHSLAGN